MLSKKDYAVLCYIQENKKINGLDVIKHFLESEYNNVDQNYLLSLVKSNYLNKGYGTTDFSFSIGDYGERLMTEYETEIQNSKLQVESNEISKKANEIAEKALKKSKMSNCIAFISTIIAVLSFIVSVITIFLKL